MAAVLHTWRGLPGAIFGGPSPNLDSHPRTELELHAAVYTHRETAAPANRHCLCDLGRYAETGPHHIKPIDQVVEPGGRKSEG